MIAQLVAHRHLAAIITLITTLVACYGKGVDVSVVGIPADTQVTVSVDSLRQDIAAAPSKVYRYKGVGYARLLGLAAAPSYTATARRLDGCTVAVGSVEYNGEDEVRIDLHAVWVMTRWPSCTTSDVAGIGISLSATRQTSNIRLSALRV